MTEFEGKIYDVVRRISKGNVLTYKEVAELIGRPKAYRAVGNALNRAPTLMHECGGKNPFAPNVPCHRVIRSDGKIGGYAQGTRNKIKLLKSEGLKIKYQKSNIKITY